MNFVIFERKPRQPYNENLCLFEALALHLHGNENVQEETSKMFNLFLENSEERDVSKLQGVHLNEIPKVEDLLQLIIFLYDIDFVDGELIGELCRRSVQKYERGVKICATTITFATSTTSTHCYKRSCVLRVTHFSQRRGIWNHICFFVVIVLSIYPNNVCKPRKTRFEKLDAFSIPYRNEQKLFKNLAIFDFESICVKED